MPRPTEGTFSSNCTLTCRAATPPAAVLAAPVGVNWTGELAAV